MFIKSKKILNEAKSYLSEEPCKDYRMQIEKLLINLKDKDDYTFAELNDRLLGNFSFGTAGLRAKMQGGYKRINDVTVARVSWALGTYLLQKNKICTVVIGFDARINSIHFSKLSAKIFIGMGIKVYYFDNVIPTPILSFSVLKLNATAGIMITASHNAAEYNGYKAYWNNGAQIIEPHIGNITKLMNQAPCFCDIIKLSSFNEKFNNLYCNIPYNIVESYFFYIKQNKLSSPKKKQLNLKIVYTALHGVGGKHVLRALNDAGFYNVDIVKSQQKPDGLFPTIKFPNPEEKGSLDKIIAAANKHNSELALANDPDADRLAVLVRRKNSKNITLLTGNQVGILLGYYSICYAKKNEKKNLLVISTLVSSRMLEQLANYYDVKYIETITGFSHIINAGINDECTNNSKFIFGFEEALGYCFDDFVRDKDGICAAVRFAQFFAELKGVGKDPLLLLDELAIKHGNFQDLQWSKVFNSPSASVKIKKIMNFFRNDFKCFKLLNNEKIVKKRDLKNELESYDILTYFTNLNTRIVVRPSGTEPKIKFYIETIDYVENKSSLMVSRMKNYIKLKKIKKEFLNKIEYFNR